MTEGAEMSSTSLDELVRTLGPALVSVLPVPKSGLAKVRAVVIADPRDASQWPVGALLLAPGAHDADAVLDLLRRAKARGAAGVVLRSPIELDDASRAMAVASGTAVCELAPDVPWTHLSDAVRAVLAAGEQVTGEAQLGGLAAGDLFAVTNAVSDLLDTPITLEDRHSRVLAWSAYQEDVDRTRVAGIVGRQAPHWLTETLVSRGVFTDLDASQEPVYVDLEVPEMLPRMGMAVRAGAEVVGYLWAAVREPFTTDLSQKLQELSKVVAIHVVHHRAQLDSRGALLAELASEVLSGGEQASDAAARLGIDMAKLSVLAAQVVRNCADTPEVALNRLTNLLGTAMSAAHPDAVTAVLGKVVYVLLPWPTNMSVTAAHDRSVRLARDFVDQVGKRAGAVIAVGGVADDVHQAAQARVEAEQVLRALRERPELPPVATMADVQLTSLLLRLNDLLRAGGQLLTGPVEVLAVHDLTHRTQFTESLRAYLDAFGDIKAAADRMHVHPNTFRQRLRRLCEISGLDLSDSEARLQAQLHLRLLALSATQ
ncbi:helix-turn-helix domain-containing protein [Saccharopolyspora shandongensis]|uniref:PucR family transcriptional regulator n=1 Tax=Saccharopolyspora shandongensis TaxID=418495 RepID=UPI003429E15A